MLSIKHFLKNVIDAIDYNVHDSLTFYIPLPE